MAIDAKSLQIAKIFIKSPSVASARTQFAALTADQRLAALQELSGDAKLGSQIAPALNGLFSDPSMGTAARQLHAQLFAVASTNIPDNISKPLDGVSRDVADIAKGIEKLKTSFEEPNGIRGQMEKAKDLASKAKAGIDADPDLAGDDDLKAAASQYGAVILEIDNALLYLDSLSSELAKMLGGFKEAVTNQEEYLFDDQLLENKLQPASGNIEKRFGSANKSLNLAERVKQFVGMIKSLAAAQMGALVGTYNGAARASIQLKEADHEKNRINEEKKTRYAGSKAALADAGAPDVELAKIDGKIAALTHDNDAMSAQEQEIDSRINGFGQKLDIAVKSANELSDIIMTSHSASSVSLKDELLELEKDGKKAEHRTADIYVQYCYRKYMAGDLNTAIIGHGNVDPEQIPEAVRIIDGLAKSSAGTGKIICLTFVLSYVPASQVTAGREDETIGNFDGLGSDETVVQIYAATADDLNEVFKALAGNAEWNALETGISPARRAAAAAPYKTDSGAMVYSLSTGVKPVEPPKKAPQSKMLEEVWAEIASIRAKNLNVFANAMKAEAGKDKGTIRSWLEKMQEKLRKEAIGEHSLADAYKNFAEGIMGLWKSNPNMTASELFDNIEASILAVAFYSIRSYLAAYPDDQIIKGDAQDAARIKALAETVEAFLRKQKFADVLGKDLFKDLVDQMISYYNTNTATVKSAELKKQILTAIYLIMDKKSKEAGVSGPVKYSIKGALQGLVPKKTGVVS